MNVYELVRLAAVDQDTEYQFIHEAAVGAKSVKAKKGAAAHTRLEIVTKKLSPYEVMFPAQSAHVGIILWISAEKYNELREQS